MDDCQHSNLEPNGSVRNRFRCADCKRYFYQERGVIKPYACAGWTWINVPSANSKSGFRKRRVQWQCKGHVTHFVPGGRVPLCDHHFANRKSEAETEAEAVEKAKANSHEAFGEEVIEASREEAQSMELRTVEPTDPESVGGVKIW